jgi:hypothetical protein
MIYDTAAVMAGIADVRQANVQRQFPQHPKTFATFGIIKDSIVKE